MINKRLFLAGLTTGLLSLSVAFPAMAGSWKNGAGDNATRWWYDNGVLEENEEEMVLGDFSMFSSIFLPIS